MTKFELEGAEVLLWRALKAHIALSHVLEKLELDDSAWAEIDSAGDDHLQTRLDAGKYFKSRLGGMILIKVLSKGEVTYAVGEDGLKAIVRFPDEAM